MNIITKLHQKIKSNQQQGRAFETMIRASLKRLSEDSNNKLWFTRLYDYRSFIRLNPKFKAIKQPGDFLVCYHGRFCVIECKSSQANRFNPKNVRSNQEQSMIEIEKAGGIYWLLILHRGASSSEHVLYALRRKNWFYLQLHSNEGFKTYSWMQIAEQGVTLKRKSGVWNLAPLFVEEHSDEFDAGFEHAQETVRTWINLSDLAPEHEEM